jgi:hypothetical protein
MAPHKKLPCVNLIRRQIHCLHYHHHDNQRILFKNGIHKHDIDISEMDRIQRGQSTRHFEKAKKKAPALQKAELFRNSSNSSAASATQAASSLSLSPSSTTTAWQQLYPQRSFSIIFCGADTIALMAESLALRDVICPVLDRVLLA